MGALVSGKLHGRCRALHWDEPLHLYRCGMVSQPATVLPWLPGWCAGAVSRLAHHAAPVQVQRLIPVQRPAAPVQLAADQSAHGAGLCRTADAAAIAGLARPGFGRRRVMQMDHDGAVCGPVARRHPVDSDRGFPGL
jgi:hypothetical protein